MFPPEVRALGRTRARWHDQIVAWHRSRDEWPRGGAQQPRQAGQWGAFGFRSFRRYRIRSLLYPGGRNGDEMAPGEGGTFWRWQEAALAPTCRSCLRVVDTWFPKADLPAGALLLVAIVAEMVEEFSSAWVEGVPAEHVEPLRRAFRKHFRSRGWRCQTFVVDGVVHVTSEDALDAIDPALLAQRMEDAIRRIGIPTPPHGEVGAPPRLGIDWSTWVVDR